MLPVASAAELPRPIRAARRLSLAIGLAGAVLGLLGLLLPVPLPVLALGVAGGLSLPLALGWLLEGKRQPQPPAGPELRPAGPSRPCVSAPCQPQEIRCNPFFELLSPSSL
ncbi:hypothetical protein E5K00_12620 [Hymenobacter aquaticus]|uniref:Uncharacterized protein n=1 Tax=Hymenobacter aquaticus TaxID=1867101 RepID=A0A4Z0QA27_9BACT|nr:hypothetical protein [Hymenobacter aquaticus]TGE25993.1 hypothetical protein E5K00_12620 [Hymenobacter aquaticus]